MLDILIKNGTIIDGTGKKGFRGDIGIEKGLITQIGELGEKTSALKTIDAAGKMVCPGFIDILSRSDAFGTLFENPSQESLLRQGVTTIIGGNCGASLAPMISISGIDAIKKWADIKNVAINWSSMAEFLNELSTKKIGVNFGTLIGHTTLRRGLLKQDIRLLQRKEQDQMNLIVDQAMSEGAFGISAGLVYSHTKITPTEELIEISKIAAKRGGFLSLHIRNEGANIISSINEAIRISQEARIPVEIAHFKIIGRQNWPAIEKILPMIELANQNGAQITFDIFPYTFSASVLYTILPDWATKESKEQLINLLRDKEQKKNIIQEMQQNRSVDYGNIIIAMSAGDKSLIGHDMKTIAQSQGLSPEEIILNIIIESRGRMIGFVPDLSEDNIKRQISSDLSLISSNAAGYNLDYANNRELAHPRCFGAFPRAIKKYALGENVVSIEEMIAKMTSRPAKKIGLAKRGEIRLNNFADITILDTKTINDNATIDLPYQFPSGIDYVIVNGQIAVNKSDFTGLANGKVLKKVD